MIKRGPRGASVERQVETKETLTWRFTPEQLRKRLNLPGDAALSVLGIGTTWDVTDDYPLVATATVTKTKS
jgi:hypothetical protein